MFSHFQQEPISQNPIFDALYCDEERFDDDLGDGFSVKEPEVKVFAEIHQKSSVFLFEHDLLWEDDELVTLFSKEKKQPHFDYDAVECDGSLKVVRNDGIKWMLRVIFHYGFNAMTAVLAVNYYDRFITSPCFRDDKPWIGQLAAVACLSLAAKVEETQVPLLLDFQVEQAKYVFEAKTIMRMEILVLSALEWRMNPVTPISFVDHIVRRFDLLANLHWEFLRRCEDVILSTIADHRLLHYLPSVVAAATMLYVMREIDPHNALEYDDKLMSVLRTSKETVDNCHELITELIYYHCRSKRKLEQSPRSPSGVIDAYFSPDSSNDSWAVASSLSPSPEPVFKRSRAQDHVLWRG